MAHGSNAITCWRVANKDFNIADLSRHSGRGQVGFSQMRRSSSDLIENAERFAWIDLDRSRFEKRTQSLFQKLRSSNDCYDHEFVVKIVCDRGLVNV